MATKKREVGGAGREYRLAGAAIRMADRLRREHGESDVADMLASLAEAVQDLKKQNRDQIADDALYRALSDRPAAKLSLVSDVRTARMVGPRGEERLLWDLVPRRHYELLDDAWAEFALLLDGGVMIDAEWATRVRGLLRSLEESRASFKIGDDGDPEGPGGGAPE